MKMTTPDLLAFIKANPKCTNKMIAEKFKIDPTSAAARTSVLFNQDRVSREVVAKTVSGVGIFGYTWLDESTMREREKTREKAKVAPVTVAARPAPKGHLDTEVQLSPSINQSLSALAGGLADAILAQVKARLAVELSSMVPEPVPVAQMPTVQELVARTAPKQKALAALKTKALVVGLLPQQSGLIDAEFGDAFDLDFWKDESIDKLKAKCRSADVVFFHLQHSSHATEEVIRANCKTMIRVNGGMSQMKDALTKFYCEGAQS